MTKLRDNEVLIGIIDATEKFIDSEIKVLIDSNAPAGLIREFVSAKDRINKSIYTLTEDTNIDDVYPPPCEEPTENAILNLNQVVLRRTYTKSGNYKLFVIANKETTDVILNLFRSYDDIFHIISSLLHEYHDVYVTKVILNPLVGSCRVGQWLEEKFTDEDGQPRIKVVWM